MEGAGWLVQARMHMCAPGMISISGAYHHTLAHTGHRLAHAQADTATCELSTWASLAKRRLIPPLGAGSPTAASSPSSRIALRARGTVR
eukprot:1183502-Rhodomonas_salina.1